MMFKKIAYDCKRATLLIEKKQITFLSIRERFELRTHLAGCSVCRVFEKQSIIINRLVGKLIHPNSHNSSRLGKDFKDRMQKRIDQQLDGRGY